MGGCRCSYRNCKVRSDGQTHMFHFPVFDKVRCHLWITNSHKPNFLNLKLSQLKNRVICQHHFQDHNFMNYMRDRLKHDAVPTEDGPYCTPASPQPLIIEESDKPSPIPINVDDIENEKLDSVNKKAHRSIKYGDFLISDTTELFNASIDSQVSKKVSADDNVLYSDVNDLQRKLINYDDTHKYTINYVNEDKPQTSVKCLYPRKKTPSVSLIAIEYDESANLINPDTTLTKTFGKTKASLGNRSTLNPNKMVTILSEKTVTEPVLVEGKLEPVSPSMIIQKSRKFKQNLPFAQSDWDQNNQDSNKLLAYDPPILQQNIPIEYVPQALESDTVLQSSLAPSFTQNYQENISQGIFNEPLQTIHVNNIENKNILNESVGNVPIQALVEQMEKSTAKAVKVPMPASNVDKKPNFTTTSTPVYRSILKSKITPEKLAVIEEKRKFNLKMRDVITSCLDNLDESNEEIVKKIAEDKKQIVKRLILKPANPVTSSVTNQGSIKQGAMEPSLTVTYEGSIVSYLEKRLQKLENSLLHKIDHNTQRLNELKRTIKPSSHTKNANTQTYIDHTSEESQKQYLYKEISKFLSPDANIKIFQELFDVGNSQDDFDSPNPRKLRKKR